MTVKLSCAPMEGLTTSVYRAVLMRHFPGEIRFYSPFISPTSSGELNSHELRDVQPEKNEGITLIPQILTNHAEPFLFTADKLAQLGYRELNLNVGCPSGTVVSRGRGAGFLAHPEELDAFLRQIFSSSPLPISIKTRIGMSDPKEFPRLLSIYNQYNVRELIVHPRVRTDFYRGAIHPESMAYAVDNSALPLCYNGDIFTKQDFDALREKYPSLNSFMLARGQIANPALLRELSGGAPITKEELYAFQQDLFESYLALGWSEKSVLARMKEYWQYMSSLLQNQHKSFKRIAKSQDLTQYRANVDFVFAVDELVPGGGFINTF